MFLFSLFVINVNMNIYSFDTSEPIIKLEHFNGEEGHILDKFRNEKKSDLVRIQVHQDNNIAIGIYEKYGFVEVKRAEWNHDFLVMELVL
jgi:hypothetical protein